MSPSSASSGRKDDEFRMTGHQSSLPLVPPPTLHRDPQHHHHQRQQQHHPHPLDRSSPSYYNNNNYSHHYYHPQKQQRNLQEPTYHVIKLHRPSVQFPWGFSVSLFLEGPFLIVGNVHPSSTPRDTKQEHIIMVRCSRYSTHNVGSSVINPATFFSSNFSTVTNPNLLDDVSQYLFQQQPGGGDESGGSGLSSVSLSSLLYRGDCLVGINRTSIHEFPTLAHVTHAFRSCLDLELLVLRLPAANHGANLVWKRNASSNPSFEASMEACKLLQQYLAHQRGAVVSVTAPASRITSRITSALPVKSSPTTTTTTTAPLTVPQASPSPLLFQPSFNTSTTPSTIFSTATQIITPSAEAASTPINLVTPIRTPCAPSQTSSLDTAAIQHSSIAHTSDHLHISTSSRRHKLGQDHRAFQIKSNIRRSSNQQKQQKVRKQKRQLTTGLNVGVAATKNNSNHCIMETQIIIRNKNNARNTMHQNRPVWENKMSKDYKEEEDGDPDDGNRAKLFLRPIPDFYSWLRTRKQRTWFKKRRETIRNLQQQQQQHFRHYSSTHHCNVSKVDLEEECYSADPDDGKRAELFLMPIANFDIWLQTRKRTWRTKRAISRKLRQQYQQKSLDGPRATAPSQIPSWLPKPKTCYDHSLVAEYASASSNIMASSSWLGWSSPASCWSLPSPYTNPMFISDDTTGTKELPYADNWEFDPDEGRRGDLFLNPLIGNNQQSFANWLQRRKAQWRQSYKARPVPDVLEDLSYHDENHHLQSHSGGNALDRFDSNVSVDFWSRQGYPSFLHWLRASTVKWSKEYSWNKLKRKRLEHDYCEVTVHIEGDFDEWLRVRKHQWLISRRKRQRMMQQKQQHEQQILQATFEAHCGDSSVVVMKDDDVSTTTTTLASAVASPRSVAGQLSLCAIKHSPCTNPELVLIDALLEDEERQRKALEDRPPLDISFLFDEKLDCPDDTVVHILGFLDPMEYGKLLCICRKWRQSLMTRESVWRQLCPSHWKLPRRPRKPWHEIFFKSLRLESESSRKRWDDLLSKISNILLKRDNLQSVEKLVADAERGYGFDINYSSGVVCERNAILNLAVIHQRHKVVRWLVESKKADIETCDRGHFTPLLNAAWAGDKYLVRFLLQKGADRSKLGRYHYTKPLSTPDFQGLTAAEWAEKKGFKDIAELIRRGL